MLPRTETLTCSDIWSTWNYDMDSGVLRWRIKPSNEVQIGSVAGTIMTNKITGKQYVRIIYKGIGYLAHRLIWCWMTKEWPLNEIDHRDGDGLHNEWDNLREATPLQAAQNKRKHRNNTSGYTGVTFRADCEKYQARIMLERKMVSLGFFCNAEEALHAYILAKKELHVFNPLLQLNGKEAAP